MKGIYTKAERVIGWLGPDENGSSQALKTLDTLFKNAIHYPDKFEWARRMPELLTENGTYTTDSGIDIQSNDRLEKLQRLLRSPFWKRIWIVQELVLPLKLRLVCGEDFMDIPEPVLFYNTVDKLTKLTDGRPDSLPLNIWLRLNECIALLRLLAALRCRHLQQAYQVNRVWKGIPGFIRARVLLDFHETSDPRDHVYGLLGLFDFEIVPDYGQNMTVADVYLEMAQHCLRTREAQDILCLAGTRHSCDGPDCLTHVDPPSWVPDWRVSTPARLRLPRYPQSHAYPSNGGFQMRVVDHKWLRGSAIVWDTVSRTEYKTGWDLKEWDLVEDIDIEKPDDRAYPSGISRFDAIIILWHGGYDGLRTSMRDLQPDSELFRSYKAIFYAMIAKPWANKHGQRERPRLVRCMFGPSGLAVGPNAISNGHRESYLARSRQLRYDMRCFHTERKYIGLGPLAAQAGDIVCVLEGHKAPVLLRRRGSHYTFVGDCDVVGIMNGEVLEAVKRGEAEITEIELR